MTASKEKDKIDKLNKLALKIECIRNEDAEYLERYLIQLKGLIALAENQSNACDTHWLAMEYSLKSLVKIIEDDIEFRKTKLES